MKIDYKRKWLWVVSDKRDGKWFTSQVHAFDLKSGKKQQFYSLKDTIPHLFNDLDIANDGKIYLTDTYYSAIYLVDPEKEQLDLFLKSKKLDILMGSPLVIEVSFLLLPMLMDLSQLIFRQKVLLS